MFKLPGLKAPKQKLNLAIAALFMMVQIPFALLSVASVYAEKPLENPGQSAEKKDEDKKDTTVSVSNCPGSNEGNAPALPTGYEVDTKVNSQVDGELNNEVLDAGTVFCVKGGDDNSGIITADGETTLQAYLGQYVTVGQGNTPDVSYYITYTVDTDEPETDGTLTVNKVVLNANGTVRGTNELATQIGFYWVYDDTVVERDMGDTVTLEAGDYDVTENTISGYTFVGYYIGEGNCANPDGTDLPVSASVVAEQDTAVTLCNKANAVVVTDGTLTVNKVVLNANGTVRGTNELATQIGFYWVYDDTVVERDMGDTVTLEAGDYDVTENTISGYTFVGYYIGEGNCANPDGTDLPVSASVVAEQDTAVTLCNKANAVVVTDNGVVLGDTTTVVVGGGGGGAVLGAATTSTTQVVAPVGGVDAGFGAEEASSAATSLYGLIASVMLVMVGAAAFRKSE